MRFRSLILVVNMAAVLAGCMATAQRQPQAVTAVPASAPSGAPTSQFGPRPEGGAYLSALSLNLYRLLPPPPEAGSAQERAELDELLRIQARRTPEQARRAAADAQVSIFRLADALGSPPDFTPPDVPLTAALFRRIAQDESLFLNSAKEAFARPRPFLADSRLAPVVPRPPGAAYPSGHSTWVIAAAIVLADMVPERRRQIFARADEYAHNREVAGVHYPSDVAAGHLAGTALAAALFQSPRFLADEAAAAAQLRRALGLPPRPQQPLQRH